MYALDTKLRGVCLIGLIGVKSHAYIGARCTQLSSQHAVGRHPPEAPSRNQQTSMSPNQISSGNQGASVA